MHRRTQQQVRPKGACSEQTCLTFTGPPPEFEDTHALGRSPGSRITAGFSLPGPGGPVAMSNPTHRLQLRGQPRHGWRTIRTAFPFHLS